MQRVFTCVLIFLSTLLICHLFCTRSIPAVIVHSIDASKLERLAAEEVRRYLFHRTGILLPIVAHEQFDPETNSAIVISRKDRPLIGELSELPPRISHSLDKQHYLIKTVERKGKRSLFIIGGDEAGTLYGAYRFIESLGVRFFLHGDVIPDEKINFELPQVDIRGEPLFVLRGIQPFHDFPEGPDWWNVDDYKAVMAQLPKMGMNFFGLHTYPEGEVGPEPLTWIGLPDDSNIDGEVKFSYPARHFSTLTDQWGYSPKKTGEFGYGAADMFETDDYGADYMSGVNPWKQASPESWNRLFDDVGRLLNEAFGFARQLGIRTCIGTEIPLTIPSEVCKRLESQGENPGIPAIIGELYEGMFRRILNTHPLDYYWFWTPEYWTWDEDQVDEETLERTERDILLAVAAAEKIKAPFTLATCGWVLGPPGDRTRFDRLLPREMPFSCINRHVGFAPVESGFSALSDRPKWAIPWLEDDPALISPQLWVGRMRRDAVDALRYGCTGLMGIHWRTRNVGPNVAALAKAGWLQGDWGQKSDDPQRRDLDSDDFYADWARILFGSGVADEVAEIFVELDGGPLYKGEGDRKANLYRTSMWQKGPGAIKPQSLPWEEVKGRFDFIDRLERLRERIETPGNLDRFDYWLNTFRYARSTARVGCLLGALDRIKKSVESEKAENRRRLARETALPVRIQLADEWYIMVGFLLTAVSTPGELGTVANLEQHSMKNLDLLQSYDDWLTDVLGEPLPAELSVPRRYRGELRVIVPTIRTVLEADESLALKVIILTANRVKNADLSWRPLGSGRYAKKPLVHIARGVYGVELGLEEIRQSSFEYFIDVADEKQSIVFPATAPEIAQSVVVWK